MLGFAFFLFLLQLYYNILMKYPRRNFTFKIADPCPWYSVHSPGTVSGNFMERKVPVDVPANNILPECDMATAVRIISLASTVRKTCNENKTYKYVSECFKLVV